MKWRAAVSNAIVGRHRDGTIAGKIPALSLIQDIDSISFQNMGVHCSTLIKPEPAATILYLC